MFPIAENATVLAQKTFKNEWALLEATLFVYAIFVYCFKTKEKAF